MFLVGLTGGFGSGKSTVAATLAALGLKVISADELARDVCRPGMPAYDEIVEAFGEGVVAEDGSLDRKRLGDIVFADPAFLRRLNGIVHPRVIALEGELLKQIEESAKDAIVVLDVPLLIEVERHRLVDFVVVVNAPTEQRFERLKKKFGGLDRAALEARMGQQMPLEEKVKLADFVVDNSGEPEATREQTEKLFRILIDRQTRRTRSL
ncbi:MAG: dephospho-CoA kinase [Candidatus Coatesbacteria bacterium]|nr:dephospho-CoA kinase [Candidatus Coatesbacteria bacterium]